MTLSFSRSLYSEPALRAAIDAYQELADFELKPQSNDFEVVLSNVDPEFGDRLLDEFANHALFETIERYRAASEEA